MRRKSPGEIKSRHPAAPAARGGALMRPSITAAFTQALFQEWAERGYGAMTLEAVAKRAGVGKAALYRRWPSKLPMVIDCLEQIGREAAVVPEVPDTGSLKGDLKALLSGLRRVLRHPLVRRILPDLQAEVLRSPELALAIQGRLQSEYKDPGAAMLQRAIARREIPAGIDMDLAMDGIGAMIYWRMIITQGQADDKYLDRLSSFIVAALRS